MLCIAEYLLFYFTLAVSKAYSTLSDPTRRNHYDRFGEDGLREHVTSPADVSPDDLFRMFFGDGDRGVFFEDDGRYCDVNFTLVSYY